MTAGSRPAAGDRPGVGVAEDPWGGPPPRFPPDFIWGTAASATQAEGAVPNDTWYAWENEQGLARSGAGNDFSSRYDEDFALLASLGLTHHRLTLDWARLEPESGRHDEAAVEHYRQVLASARAAGIETWGCLHHFTLPQWFADQGGFVGGARAWRSHVDFVADTFGDLVHGWQPINEPMGFAAGGWLVGVHPPGHRDLRLFFEMLEAIHREGLEACRRLRGSGPVATVYNLVPHFPADDDPRTIAATEVVEDLYWRSWIRMFTDGVLEVGGREPVDVAQGAESVDLIGFSYYMARTVHADLSRTPYPADAEVTERGDVPWSGGLAIVLDRLVDALPGRALLVAEHGVGTTDDHLRCRVLASSLRILSEAIDRGADVRGFFHWTGIDNYEWEHGWRVPFGCIDSERSPKPSAQLLASVARR